MSSTQVPNNIEKADTDDDSHGSHCDHLHVEDGLEGMDADEKKEYIKKLTMKRSKSLHRKAYVREQEKAEEKEQ